MKFDFIQLGGDLRFDYLNHILKNNNYKIFPYKFKKISDKEGLDAFKNSKYIIGPIPFIRNKKITNTDISFSDILPFFKEGQTLFSSNIDKDIVNLLNDKKIKVYDFNLNENFTILNSVATAEGAICDAISLSKLNLHLANVLVLGFGKCAKTLSLKLKGIGSNVSIMARRKEALSLANSLGFKSYNLSQLKDKINEFAFIFNTIPAQIIDKDIALNIDNDATFIDIASYPGCLKDLDLKETKFSYNLSLGLPSKYAPYQSALIIYDLIYEYIKNKR